MKLDLIARLFERGEQHHETVSGGWWVEAAMVAVVFGIIWGIWE